MLTHEKEVKLTENLTIITMEGIYDGAYDNLDIQEMSNQNIFSSIISTYKFYGLVTSKFDYNTTGLQTLLDYPADHKFDLIIYESSLGRYFYPLIERFHNPPVLAVTPFLFPPALSYVFGNHLQPSYIPFFSTRYTTKMSLSQRILNFVYTYTEILYRIYIYSPREEALAKGRFKGLQQSLDEIERRVGLLLCNVNPVMGYPEALLPNIIPVGGLHAAPSKPLPEDLKKLMDNSKNGVILFSLGTNIKVDLLSLETRQALLKAFSRLPQTVLWKFDSDNIQELPKNVFIRKWLPQNDILGHPNTKLFINHGGALSSQEAIYHGIPVVGIPYVFDQINNVRKLVDKGVAVYLDKNDLTKENVYEAIQTALKFAPIKMKELSKQYRGLPQTALEKAVFWIEYFLRHGNAEHLVPEARDMPAYQTSSFDVILVLLLCLLIIYLLVLFLKSCLFGK
ncbi:hypothetical protein ILUMI_17320 [Ignelater luminosus]|uniref:UDP-glucuronosyltransferase n=1 Tax=Ignelater luminosus TaxID=2038154 RepID=A0A8K0G7E0_IGNLU|nr:hypothetical protein ILUMI_17320 [Ignelater luminosus]